VRLDNLCIHSNRGDDPAFAWAQPAGTPAAEGYAVLFDRSPGTLPPEQVTTTGRRAEYRDVAPGDWTVHVRAQNRHGWGPTAHVSVRVLPPSGEP
jgi:hypothetical protein